MILVDSHHRGHKPLAFGGGNHKGFAALHYRRNRVGRAKIDANDFCHKINSPLQDAIVSFFREAISSNWPTGNCFVAANAPRNDIKCLIVRRAPAPGG
jgi:hypothetical protein